MSLSLPTGSSSPNNNGWVDSPSPTRNTSPTSPRRSQQESLKEPTETRQASSSNAASTSSGQNTIAAFTSPAFKLSTSELKKVLSQKNDIRQAAEANRLQQRKTLGLLVNIRSAYQQVQEVQNRLSYADQVEEEDSELAIMPYADHQSVSLPKFPKLVDSIPLLRVQADENLQFRQLTTIVAWLANDVALLKKAVLSECKRIFYTQMMKDPLVSNPDQVLSKMTEDELLIASLPLSMKERLNPSQTEESGNEPHSQEEDEETQVNWETVSKKVGTHSAEDCRTKWLMNDRPNLMTKTWSLEEQNKLKEMVENLYAKKEERRKASEKGKEKQRESHRNDSLLDGDVFFEGEERNWEEIAKTLNTGRNGIQCLMAYTRSASKSRADPFTEREDEELLRLIKVLGPRWNTISERLGTNREAYKLHHRYVTALDSTIFRGKWFSHEDENLIRALEILGEDTDDWRSVAFYVPGRNRQQCRERWKGRLSLTTALGKQGVGSEVRRAWTKEEDDRLRECAGKNWTWVEVADYIGNRSDKQARDRFIVLKNQDERAARRAGSHSEQASTPKTEVASKRRMMPSDSDLENDPDQEDGVEDEVGIRDQASEVLRPPKSTPRAKRAKTSSKETISLRPKESKLTCPEFKPDGLPCEKTFVQFKTLQNHLKKVHEREIQEPPKMRKFESKESQAEKRKDGRRGKKRKEAAEEDAGQEVEDSNRDAGDQVEEEESRVEVDHHQQEPMRNGAGLEAAGNGEAPAEGAKRKKKITPKARESETERKEKEIMSWIRGKGKAAGIGPGGWKK